MAAPNVAGVVDAKTHLSELLEQVAKDDSFVIAHRGKPIARLVPATPVAPQLSVDDIVTSAKALRLKVQVSEAEICS
jgi:prevent-host-death family protein